MADALVSVSKYTAKKTLPLCKQSDRDYRVIYNSVDAKKFAPSKEILQEEGHILFVGSVIPKKGIEQLILAMNIVSARYSYARLTVVGKTDYRLASGQLYKDYLLSLLNEEIANRVIFVGSVDRNTELLNYLRRAHVCCYPSHSEAFAIAPLEAMSVGKATISTEAASGPEAIQDNVNGLLCNPFSPESIASKIMSVLSNPAFAAILGFNARQEILQRFNYSDWITANISHYEDVTKEFRGKHL